MTHAIITDRGENWEQFRYQVNIKGDSSYEESEDTVELALQECNKIGADKITIYTNSYFNA